MVSIHRFIGFAWGGFALAIVAAGCTVSTGAPAGDGTSVETTHQELTSCGVQCDDPEVIDCNDSTNDVCLECFPGNPNGIFCCPLGGCTILPKPPVRVRPPILGRPPVAPIGAFAQ